MGILLLTINVLAICMLQVLAQLHDGEGGLALAAGEENHNNVTTPFQLQGGSMLLKPSQNTFWVSPGNVFALGFLKTPISSSSSSSSAEPSFILSVFYSYLSQFHITPVWTPHRGHLLTQNATLHFTAQGDLVLSDSGKQTWHTNTIMSGVATIHVSDEGNVLLYGENSSKIWQSWDEPITDTLLPGQALLSGTDVVDNKGRYLLRVQTDSNFVLYFLGSLTKQTTNYYWSSDTWNLNVSGAYYNTSQGLVLIDNKEQIVSILLQTSLPTQLERIVMSESGTLTRYMLSADAKSWSVAAQIPSSACYVIGLCGAYGICMDDNSIITDTKDMDNYNCTCPDGFNYVDANDWFAGCGTNYPLDCDRGSKLTRLPGVQYGATYSSPTPDWSNYHYDNFISSVDQCVQSCNSSCRCAAATYDGENCHLSSVGQVNSGNMKSSTYVTYLKTSVYPTDNSTRNYTLGQVTVKEGETKRVVSIGAAIGIGVALGLACIVGLANLALWYHRSRQANMNGEDVEGAEDELPLLGGGPVQFSYNQLKEASNGFKNLLGKGGFGPVYKGVLAGGALVAIKRLEGSTYGEKQFRAEVITIGSVHHMNLVRLRGYCAEGPHRMLVYEFMLRGSLDKYIFRNQSTDNPEGQIFLDWKSRFQILLSTARAIRYLHEECQPYIVHCDIKPENILLGEAFNAKVSDFGMAQLVGGEAGHTGSITRVRGTFGYMAPEWMSSKHITTKVDVYSFGIVVLEVISGRRAIDSDAESESKMDLSTWAYSQVMEHSAALAILDPRLCLQGTTDAPQDALPHQPTSTHTPQFVTTEDARASELAPELDRAAFVALWCINKDPSIRPSMGLVVQLLEGIMPMDPPPYPF